MRLRMNRGWVSFPVYSPQSGSSWLMYLDRWWRAPWVFLRLLVRGLRFRFRRPALGRAVTLDDMLTAHPGNPSRCSCYGHGIVWTYRNGEREGQFCEAMASAFRRRARGRVATTEYGPRWLAAFESERAA